MMSAASAVIWGWAVMVCPAMVTSTLCSGWSAWMMRLMDMPVVSCRWRATARAAMTVVRWTSMESRWWWKTGRARRSCLDMCHDCSTCHRERQEATTSPAPIRGRSCWSRTP